MRIRHAAGFIPAAQGSRPPLAGLFMVAYFLIRLGAVTANADDHAAHDGPRHACWAG
jgi:hypothetical protein